MSEPAAVEETVDEPVEAPETGAETEETSVEPELDIATLLGEQEEESVGEEDRRVPEKTFLKMKSKAKHLKKEVEGLRTLLTQNEEQAPVQEPTNVKLPNPEDYENGMYDPKYQQDFVTVQTDMMKSMVVDTMQQEHKRSTVNDYMSNYNERLDISMPIAEKRLTEYARAKPEFKKSLESPKFASMVANLPIEIQTELTENKHIPQILDYYSKKPEKLLSLSKSRVSSIIEFGKLLGTIERAPSSNSTPPPITPIKSHGDNSSKLHPIKDHAKYDQKTFEGRQRWERDVEKLRKGEL